MQANAANGESSVLRDEDPFEQLLRNWSELASVAWEGHLTLGRGAVHVIHSGDSIHAEYFPGSPCGCHSEAVEKYDPATEAVFVLRHGDGEEDFALYILGGWPEPPAAFATVSADSVGAAIH